MINRVVGAREGAGQTGRPRGDEAPESHTRRAHLPLAHAPAGYPGGLVRAGG